MVQTNSSKKIGPVNQGTAKYRILGGANNGNAGSLNDDSIIHGCLQGNRKAQQALYERYKSMLFGICLRYSSSQQEAEDWLQDGLLAIYANIHRYRPIGALGAWLRSIMVNTVLSQLKKQRLKVVAMKEWMEHKGSSEDVFSKFRKEDLILMLQHLPNGYRAVFNLYVMEEYSHQEIGEMLGIGESGSRSQLARAKAKLRNMVEKSTLLAA
jgi:RNA polymerase sigma-70 factor (ECF subfamily)